MTDKYTGRLLLHPYFTMFCRLAFGGVLVFAGIAKVYHTDVLLWAIIQYHILPFGLAEIYSRTLPYLEIILGVLLILGIYIRISALFSGFLALSFLIAKITAFARGLDIDICPCFGPAVPLLTISSLAIDIALLALTLQLLWHRGEFLSVDALFARSKSGDK